MEIRAILFLPFIVLPLSCNRSPHARSSPDKPGPAGHPVLSDPNGTPLAQSLLLNLAELAGERVMLGHQDALAYGVEWRGADFRTDIGDVLGDHPAVFGWDLGHLGDSTNIDGVSFSEMQRLAEAAWNRGGINSYSWHMRNLAVPQGAAGDGNWKRGSSWDTTPCVAECLPGGSAHDLYIAKLDQAAAFFSGIRDEEGNLIPVIFRPFHEMTGGWFWWGKGNCTAGEYRELFRFTVDYLRKEKGMNQLIVAYSTDVFRSASDYMERYPGDGYADVLAFDDYHGVVSPETATSTIRMLEMLDSLSASHGKLMALSETGVETIPDPEWFTGTLLKILDASEATRRISWVLLWRNGRPDHFYAPHPGHPAVPDFRKFMDHPLMVSLSELPDLTKTDN